jgi:hypothetical protein
MLLNDLLKEFSAKAVLNYARTRVTRVYLGPTLFPENTVNELSYEYWKAINRLPVMASFQAFGAEAQIASREGASKVAGEIPPIKRKIPLNERLLIALKREGAGDADMIRNTIYNDLDNLIESVRARIEKARMDAIANGVIELNENGMVMKVDFQVPNTHKAILADVNDPAGFWSYADADPITQIQSWTQTILDDTGIKPERALTSTPVVSSMLKNVNIRKMIYGDNGGSRPVTLTQINQLLGSMELPMIGTYDLKVRAQAEDGTYEQLRFFPANKFVLLPGVSLGDTLVGPTAEALLSADISSQEAPGVYATVDVQKEPVGLWTKVAMAAFPTFPMADSVFQATVLKD